MKRVAAQTLFQSRAKRLDGCDDRFHRFAIAGIGRALAPPAGFALRQGDGDDVGVGAAATRNGEAALDGELVVGEGEVALGGRP